MKKIVSFLIIICLCACSNHDNLMYEYKKGNPDARDLLLHGINEKNCYYVDSYLLKRALQGDEEAKNIIYAQINTLSNMPEEKTHIVPVVVPIHTSRR